MMRTALALTMAVAFVIAVCGCEREQRTFRPSPSLDVPASDIQLSQLRPGGTTAPPPPSVPPDYKETADTIKAGQQLFSYYNCAGCHAHGGGAIGPPLMDVNWVYGSEPANIFATIMDGRPNGMPSWRGRIPEYQAWEIVAYVRALSGQVPSQLAIRPQPDITTEETGAKPQPSGTTGSEKQH